MAVAASESWPLVKLTDAGQVIADIGEEVPLPAAPGTRPQDYFAQLVEGEHLAEAITFLAHSLPRYECVVWGARALLETDTANRRDPLVSATLRWIDSPNDEVRRSIGALAEQERNATPAVLLANAVWLSGGSLSDPELPAVLPATHVCAKLVAGALLKAAYATTDPSASLRLMLVGGEELARGQAGR